MHCKNPYAIGDDLDNRIKKLVADSNRRGEVKPTPVYAGVVPDVSGLGLKDAVYLLEKGGMHVTIKGRGKVVSQSVTPGTKIVKGQSIILQLS